MTLTKSIVITLIDGKVITRDLTTAIAVGIKAGNPVTAFGKANAQFFAVVMQEMASYGFIHYESSNDLYARYICPSQIKNIEIVFSDNSQMGISK